MLMWNKIPTFQTLSLSLLSLTDISETSEFYSTSTWLTAQDDFITSGGRHQEFQVLYPSLEPCY